MHESFNELLTNKFPPLIFCSSEHLKISSGYGLGGWEEGLLTSHFGNRLSSRAPRYSKLFDRKVKVIQSSSKGNNMLDLNTVRDKINLKSELQYN